MSINHGASFDGVGGAADAGPSAVNDVKADALVYANNKPTSQAGNDVLSFERVRKLVQGAVDDIKFDARYGSPLADAPGVEEFRRQYYALMCQVRDGEHRAYIRKKFKVVWAWAGDHQPRRLRDQRGYSLILRDKIFKDGELRADLHPIQEVALPPERPAIGEQPPPIDTELLAIGWAAARRRPHAWTGPPLPIDMAELLDRHRGTPRLAAHFTQNPHRVAEIVPHVSDEDFPAELLPIIHEFALVAVRDPMAVADLWMKHHDVFSALWEPLLKEHIERSGAIEQPPRQIEREPLAPSATMLTASPAIVEDDPPPLAPIAPQVVEEVIPPEHDPPSPTPADVIPIEEETPPPPTQPAAKMEAQPSVPYISGARMAEIEAANLSATLALASAGVPVFPARLDWNAEAKKWDKQPAIKGWKKAATTDPEPIRRWWRDLPRKLGLPAYRLVPGIWCGHPALDWVVVDADRHGGPDGVSALHALVAEPGNELPAGPRTLTAGSGVHYVFRQPPGKTKFGNSKGELPGGVDIRGVDGWIVGPGAMRPDGKMWRTADDAPSLIEAYRNGTIAVIPPWLADLIRAPKPRKERTPKNKTEAKEAKPSPSTASIPSDKTGTKREKAWARGALNKIVEKLAAMVPSSGRNEYLYRKAFFMGTTACRGWIDRRSVESEMYSACEKNGLVADGDDVRGAIERGLNDGSGCPHEDLPDRRTKAARQQRDSTTAWKNLLPTEIFRLLRVRPGGEFATDDAAKDVLAAIRREGHVIDNLDRRQLGDLLGATFKEWKAIGAMFDRHPSRFLPYDATQEEVDAHIAAVRKARNPDRARAARERRAHEKLEREQQQPPTNELEARRCAAIIRFLEQHPGPQPIGQLVHGLKRAKAFEDLTNRSRRNAILRLVSPPVRKLRELLIVTIGTARNRKPTLLVELRQ